MVQFHQIVAFVALFASGVFSQPTSVARNNDFTHHVSLRRLTPTPDGSFAVKHFCSGAIVSNRWILTVAHCTHRERMNEEPFVLVVGAKHVEADGVIYQSEEIINHPFYHIDTEDFLKYDISLVRTQHEIVFGLTVQPIPLEFLTIGGEVEAIISGWGKVNLLLQTKEFEFEQNFF